MEKVILIGAGGHFKVVADILKDKYLISGVLDNDSSKHGKISYGISVLGGDEILENMYEEGIMLSMITLGSVGPNPVRQKLYYIAKEIGFSMVNAISPNSIISPSVTMGEGSAIMDGAVIHADAEIGNNTIINTGAIIEHDCHIGDHVHVSIGARLAGGVKVGPGSFIGMGANIIQGISIGENCVIGAGAVVIENVPDNSKCIGVPARITGM